MIRASSKAKSHFMDGRARLWIRARSKRCSERGKADANGKLSWFEAIERQSQKESRARNQSRRSSRGVVLRTLFARLESGKKTMPEAPQRTLFFVAPGKMAVQTIKFLRNNFQRAKNANERGGNEFAGHLRILDIRGAALRAANQGGGNVRISRFPINHQALCPLEIVILHHHLSIRLRPRHEPDLLQRRFIVNIGLQSNVVEAPFKLPRFCRFVKRRDRHHRFLCLRDSASSDQTSTNGQTQDLAEETTCRASDKPAHL